MFKEKKNFDMLEVLNGPLQKKCCYTYDSLVTAKIYPFKSAEDYYAQASCAQRMKYIRTPTLYLTAMDDPVILESALDY